MVMEPLPPPPFRSVMSIANAWPLLVPLPEMCTDFCAFAAVAVLARISVTDREAMPFDDADGADVEPELPPDEDAPHPLSANPTTRPAATTVVTLMTVPSSNI